MSAAGNEAIGVRTDVYEAIRLVSERTGVSIRRAVDNIVAGYLEMMCERMAWTNEQDMAEEIQALDLMKRHRSEEAGK